MFPHASNEEMYFVGCIMSCKMGKTNAELNCDAEVIHFSITRLVNNNWLIDFELNLHCTRMNVMLFT